MDILNYTTTVDSFKTVSEIEHILVKHNAKSIMKNYDGENITGVSFLIDTGVQQIPVRAFWVNQNTGGIGITI